MSGSMASKSRIAQLEAHRDQWRRIAYLHLDAIERVASRLEISDVKGALAIIAEHETAWTEPEGES